jgi:hypothetical protein
VDISPLTYKTTQNMGGTLYLLFCGGCDSPDDRLQQCLDLVIG